jgi:hypothetical protein
VNIDRVSETDDTWPGGVPMRGFLGPPLLGVAWLIAITVLNVLYSDGMLMFFKEVVNCYKFIPIH